MQRPLSVRASLCNCSVDVGDVLWKQFLFDFDAVKNVIWTQCKNLQMLTMQKRILQNTDTYVSAANVTLHTVARQNRILLTETHSLSLLGAWITKSWHPYAIVAVIAVACGLLVKPAIDFTRVGGIRCFAPIDTAVYETFQNQLIPQFGGGRVFPYTLVVQVR